MAIETKQSGKIITGKNESAVDKRRMKAGPPGKRRLAKSLSQET